MPSPAPHSRKTPGYTYLTNHTHALVALDADPGARVRDLAQAIGITERAVQRILSELASEGVLVTVKEGRRNRYEIVREAKLRHPLESHCHVGGLLDWVRRSSRPSGRSKA